MNSYIIEPNTAKANIATAIILHKILYALRSDLRLTLPSIRRGTTNQRIKLIIIDITMFLFLAGGYN